MDWDRILAGVLVHESLSKQWREALKQYLQATRKTTQPRFDRKVFYGEYQDPETCKGIVIPTDKRPEPEITVCTCDMQTVLLRSGCQCGAANSEVK